MKKKIIIGLIVIICFIGLSPFALSIFDSKAPPRYSSVEEFETELNTTMHDYYDCVKYIENNQKILLRNSPNNISISSKGFELFNKKKLNYLIKIGNTCTYSVGINTEIHQSHKNIQQYSLSKGTVNQYNYLEDYDGNRNMQSVVTIYYQDNFYCQIGYTYFEGDLDLKEVQDKMITFFKDFETLNEDVL